MIKSSNPNKNLTNPDQIEEDRVSEHSLVPILLKLLKQ